MTDENKSGEVIKPLKQGQLPPVPKWWWEHGRIDRLEKIQQEAQEFDRIISQQIK